MFSRSNNHTPAMLELSSGVFRQGFPSIASWLMYGLGTANNSLPGSFVFHAPKKPRGEDPIWSTGFLPKIYQATAIDGGNQKVIDNLNRLKALNDKQQRSQLDALNFLNSNHRGPRLNTNDLEARQEAYKLAYRMQTSAPEAFDLTSERESTREAYGLNNNQTKLVGKQLLTARRLVERGVRFIHVFAGTNGGGGGVNDVPWDGHNDIKANHLVAAKSVDQPIGTLLSDLKQRGMLDETLVIWGGEFGRTSDAQDGGTGRDHNPNAFTMWFAGGGIKGGVQYGRTDDFGYKAIEKRTSVNDLHATILHLMGLDHLKLTYRHNGRDFRLTDVAGEVIHDILA
jgi:membrane-anchored protein YejM (alkaline phosphatase superfamily)